MELEDSSVSIPLAMAYSVKIEPGGYRTVPLECNKKLLHQMDTRINAGFHHRNPNVYIPPSCIDNLGNKFEPQYKSVLSALPPPPSMQKHVDSDTVWMTHAKIDQN